jgi:hypothetical protein
MSISNSAMLVELNISVWTGQKVDRKATIRATDDARASSDAGQFKKNLMAGTTLRKELADYAALCRTWHNGRTLPWADKGARLLPTSMFFDYKQEANARQAHFNALRDRFVAEYPQLLAQAPLHLGDLFDPSDYPSAEEVASKFGFRLVFLPVAESGDFRIDVGNAELAELREQYESAYEVRVQEAMGTAWDKLHDALVVMSEKLTEPEGEKAKLFHGTFVSNAVELCSLLSHLNVTKDPKLEMARRDLERAIANVDVTDIRENPGVRMDLKAQVDAVLGKYEW